MTKKEMVTNILDDIRENEYDSKEFLYALARQALEAMSKKELEETYSARE